MSDFEDDDLSEPTSTLDTGVRTIYTPDEVRLMKFSLVNDLHARPFPTMIWTIIDPNGIEMRMGFSQYSAPYLQEIVNELLTGRPADTLNQSMNPWSWPHGTTEFSDRSVNAAIDYTLTYS